MGERLNRELSSACLTWRRRRIHHHRWWSRDVTLRHQSSAPPRYVLAVSRQSTAITRRRGRDSRRREAPRVAPARACPALPVPARAAATHRRHQTALSTTTDVDAETDDNNEAKRSPPP